MRITIAIVSLTLAIVYTTAVLTSPFIFGYIAYEITGMLGMHDVLRWSIAVATWTTITSQVMITAKKK